MNVKGGSKMAAKKLKLEIDAMRRDSFYKSLAKTRQWIDGFEAAGKQGPCDGHVLRLMQIWLREAK